MAPSMSDSEAFFLQSVQFYLVAGENNNGFMGGGTLEQDYCNPRNGLVPRQMPPSQSNTVNSNLLLVTTPRIWSV